MFKSFLIFCWLPLSIFAKPIFLGIAGGTGSGKTTFAEKIHQAFPESVLISQDSYYNDLSHLPIKERGKINFDHPDSLEFSLLKNHLIELRNGRAIDCPIYNFHIDVREEKTKRILPAQIVIVEGILLFASPEVRDLFDIKIFLDTDADVRVLRRIERDMKERSGNFNTIKEQYLKTVKPMHDALIEPSKKYADIIILQQVENQVVMQLLQAMLERQI